MSLKNLILIALISMTPIDAQLDCKTLNPCPSTPRFKLFGRCCCKNALRVCTAPKKKNDNCDCMCPMDPPCDGDKIKNPDTCACECPVDESCMAPKATNADTCACECSDTSACPGGQARDPTTCVCGCPDTSACPGGQTRDPTTCVCGCPDKPNQTPCGDRKVYDDLMCQCKCRRNLDTNPCPAPRVNFCTDDCRCKRSCADPASPADEDN